MGTIIFLLTVIAVGIVCSEGRCPSSNWMYNMGFCYLIPDVPNLSWSDGRQFCRSRGGDLILPNSPEQETFVRQQLVDSYDGVEFSRTWLRCCSLDNPSKCTVLVPEDGTRKDGVNCQLVRRVMCQAGPFPHPQSFACSMVSRTESHCLSGHVVSEIKGKTHIQCCVACSLLNNCRSINLKGKMCQLNNVTISGVDGSFNKAMEDCVYYEYKVL